LAQEKFSALAYANRLTSRRERTQTVAAPPGGESQREERQDFRRWVEEIRGELVAFRGKTEEERDQFSETLNRAILGYEADRNRLLAMIHDMLAKKRVSDVPPPGSNYRTLAEAIFAEIIGLSVLELILKNKEGLEEIQVVGKQIFEVRQGRAVKSVHQFSSVKELERIQQNLVLFNNESLSRRKKWAEVSLRDGSRVTMTGFGFTAEPTLTIRLFTARHFSLDALAGPEFQTISGRMKHLMLCILRSYFNMVVIGPTNSGKTHLIKSLIAELPDEERIITLETRFELMLKRDFPQKNIIEYEVDEEDRVHDGNQAFKLALRQSPKRICNAEIRDQDANIYVRACTRGHEGSITSVHVNELEDAPDAITDMCMLDGRGMNPARLTKRITEYVTQIGFEMGVVGGKRKVVRIGEFAYENGEVKVRDWVRFDYLKGDWEYPCDISEKAARRMMKHDPEGIRRLTRMGLIRREGEWSREGESPRKGEPLPEGDWS
jgi:pilus assembly protein CpaF